MYGDKYVIKFGSYFFLFVFSFFFYFFFFGTSMQKKSPIIGDNESQGETVPKTEEIQKKNVLLCEWNFRENNCKKTLSWVRLEITARGTTIPPFEVT